MAPMSTYIALVLLGTAYGLRAWLEHAERVRRRHLLQGRERLSEAQIVELLRPFSRAPATDLLLAWEFAGQALGVEVGRLRPSDALCDLACVPEWYGHLGLTSSGLKELLNDTDLLVYCADAPDCLVMCATLGEAVGLLAEARRAR